MTRPAQAVINLQNLKDNYQVAKAHSSQAYAVIKADAYGHGMLPAARALEDADGFAVACMDEALHLRQDGIKNPILVLEGGFDKQEWLSAIEYDIEMALHHQSQLDILLTDPCFAQLKLWLKVNIGMNRLGFRIEECDSILQQCQSANLNIKVLMSHFPCADDISIQKTEHQFSALENIFNQHRTTLPNLVMSNNNSAAIMAWPNVSDHISRPGIILYGSSPLITNNSITDHTSVDSLKPVMTLKSNIVFVRTIQAGESIGYGDSWVATRTTRVGVVALGYGDGYPRTAPSGTPVYCHNQRTSLIGRVSMDMICIDITDLDEANIGSEVELWGENINANEIAKLCHTISYELFCQVTPRVKRIYIE